MQLPLQILMVFAFGWGVRKFVAARGGSSSFWTSLSVAGYVIVELGACYTLGENPSDFFLNDFPMAGVVWLVLVGLAMRLRFRHVTIKP
jgi:hypothetical protein